MPFFSLLSAPEIVSKDTSMRSAAYCIFWISAVLKPVCAARVFRSSEAVIAFMPMPMIAVSIPAAAADTLLSDWPTFPSLLPNSSISFPAAAICCAPTDPNF